MVNVLMITDPGIDDSFAIMYALLNPKMNLVEIVSGYGISRKNIADFRPKPDQELVESLEQIGLEADYQKFVVRFMEIFL